MFLEKNECFTEIIYPQNDNCTFDSCFSTLNNKPAFI